MACSPAPAHPVSATPSASASSPARGHAPVDAWLAAGGATRIGPATADGTLVLLSGRRALVRADGSVREESAPSPEALLEVERVAGARGSVLVALGGTTLFRLHDGD